jgi:hypothetical protein
MPYSGLLAPSSSLWCQHTFALSADSFAFAPPIYAAVSLLPKSLSPFGLVLSLRENLS